METKMVQQRDAMKDAINKLAEEMGPDLFADVVDFDMEMSESPYKYKILMGRRFFVLHTGLKSVIQYNYKDDLNPQGSFVTNLSIALKDLEDKKILIVDDTLLHGRAIKKIIDDLIACGCKIDNIRVKIYLRNEDAKIIDPVLLELSDCRRMKDANTWRCVSGKIVDAFLESGWPYMYYLPYYETALDSNSANRIMNFLNEQELQDHTALSQKKHGISSYLYHNKNDFRICRDSLIRIYKYEKINKLIIIPYAYLKPLTYSQIADAFGVLEDKGIKIICENGAFLRDSNIMKMSRLKTQYAYSLLTYVVSLLQGNLFLQSLGLEDWERNKTIEETSLECDIHCSEGSLEDVVAKLNEIEVVKNDFQLEENVDINCVIDDLMKETNHTEIQIQNKMDADYFLDHYLKLSSERDEQLAEQNKERMRGIEIERISKYVPDRKKVWKKIEEVIDTGRGTIAIATNIIEGETYVDSLLYAGEQNHACNEENLAVFVYPLLQYEMYCREEKIAGEDKRETKAKIIDAIMSRNGDLCERVSPHEIEQLTKDSFAQNYEAYYFDKYSMFRDMPEVQQGMKIEKEYEKIRMK